MDKSRLRTPPDPLWDDNWLPIAMIVANVVAGVEVHLLSIIKNDSNLYGRNTGNALLMSTYSALFFFLSAAVSGLILTNKFGVFLVRGSRKSDPIQSGYESKCSWIWMIRHCLVSLIAGTMSLIAQVLLYGWLEESTFLKGTLSIILGFAVLFLEHLIQVML
ncbi:hypothetical protein EDB83DRAFT_2327165 [Lactarius deliciosus]|nr:hypothetical protein EDB83DRAFT_2327165 [Lactarius deliciosus]